MIRVAINGYGRIGRIAHRVILERFGKQMEVVAINAGSSTDLKGWMYLLKYDSVYGTFPNKITVRENRQSKSDFLGEMVVSGKKIQMFSQKDPGLLPWADLDIDVVIESTGHFEDEKSLKLHIQAGAKAVVLSAPVKSGNVPTYVLSVNAKDY
ncbi:MAG: glyceraldehyde 3-phosphate dehydrogenase NAD-binding domain-containing protein, partial [Patescibacteria group bacterium]